VVVAEEQVVALSRLTIDVADVAHDAPEGTCGDGIVADAETRQGRARLRVERVTGELQRGVLASRVRFVESRRRLTRHEGPARSWESGRCAAGHPSEARRSPSGEAGSKAPPPAGDPQLAFPYGIAYSGFLSSNSGMCLRMHSLAWFSSSSLLYT
jgi:hypothetical protein